MHMTPQGAIATSALPHCGVFFSVLASESRRKTRQNLLLKQTDFSKQSLPFEIASLLQHQKRLAHIMLN